MHVKQCLLNQVWQFKPRDAAIALLDDSTSVDGWLPATVPGTVHQDLLAAGAIPDPFIGLNEREVQWIGERDWLYHCQFEVPEDWETASAVILCCDGLDTFATVWLNGSQVLVSDNMFVPARVSVQGLLRPGQNELLIVFESAVRRGQEREAEYGQRIIWGESDSSRLYVRKAQYHYGWDWGPVLLTAGIWRPIYLEMYTIRIAELDCPSEVDADLAGAVVAVKVALECAAADPPQQVMARIELVEPSGAVLEEVVLPARENEVRHTFTISNPQLWWPLHYGEQALYRVRVTLLHESEEIERRELHVGLRRLRLVQHALEGEDGRSFFFEVNNTPIFCGGANWIPVDSLLPRATAETYRSWLQLAADANMVMLRVWGGGIYEEDVFYDTCNELGLLVWQDFLFACGMYPALPWFQESVRAEAEANVQRLRHHPSIVLWCGNNEDYMHSSGIGLYDAAFEGDFSTTVFAAREIYERLLPEVCARLDPGRPYWPGSPYGGANANDGALGDQHIWDVWHGPMLPYQGYANTPGRFISEFGMQAYPARATIEMFARPDEQYAQSQTLEWHNKARDGHRRLAVYLSDTVRMPRNLDEYIYATQFVQAEAVGAGLRGWRRRWAGPGREYTAGALIWQFNDCWPVTSWALVDSVLRPKPAYYLTKRELAQLVVGLARSSASSVAIWASNGTLTAADVELEITAWTLDGQQVDEQHCAHVLPANRSIELGEYACEEDARWVIGACLRQEGRILARTTLWPEPFKYLSLPDPGITLTRLEGEKLQLQTLRPAKGVWLDAGDGVTWSDNMLDLLPDQPYVIEANGVGKREIKVHWLGKNDNVSPACM